MSKKANPAPVRLRSGDEQECSLCECRATWRVEEDGKPQNLCSDHYEDHVLAQKEKQSA